MYHIFISFSSLSVRSGANENKSGGKLPTLSLLNVELLIATLLAQGVVKVGERSFRYLC